MTKKREKRGIVQQMGLMRIGSGRKPWTFGEATKIMAVIYPKSKKKELRELINNQLKQWENPSDKQK